MEIKTPIPAHHMERLKQRPELAEDFDAKYGVGRSREVLGEERNPIADIARGAAHGVLRAVDETSDLVADGINAGVKKVSGYDPQLDPINYSDEVADAGLVDKPTTLAGSLAQGVTQFGVGFIGAGKLKFLKKLKGAKGAFVKGAVADATVFDPHEERLSNLALSFSENHPYLANPITEFLAADPSDSAAEGRFKNALEGAIAGGIVDTTMRGAMAGFKYLRAKSRGLVAEMEAALNEAASLNPAQILSDQIGSANRVGALSMETHGGPSVDPRLERVPDDAPEPIPGVPESRDLREQPSPAATEAPRIDEPARPAPADGAPKAPDAPVAAPTEALKPTVRLDAATRVRLNEALDASLDKAEAPRKSDLFNWDTLTSPDDIKAVMDEGAQFFEPRMKSAFKSETESWRSVHEKFQRLAKAAGEDPAKAILFARAHAADANQFASKVHFNLVLAESLTSRVTELARMAKSGVTRDAAGRTFGSVDEVTSELFRLGGFWGEALGHAVVARKAPGRALNYQKVKTAPNAKMMKAAQQLGDTANASADSSRVIDDILDANGQMEAVGAAFRLGPGLYRKYWINAMLSGVKTHLVNFGSNVMQMIVMPAEKAIGGTIRKLRGQTRDWAEVREAGDQLAGYVGEAHEALKMFAVAWRKHGNVLDQHSQMAPEGRGMTDTIPWEETTKAWSEGRSIDALKGAFDNLITLPTRTLMASDEMFKQLHYRSAVRARALREGRAMVESGKLDEAKLDEYVKYRFEEGFDVNGAAAVDELTGRPIFEDAFDRARRGTFTQTLEEGTAGHSIQAFVAKHPAASFIMPFVKTPTNIIRWSWYRTPGFNVLHKQWRRDWAAAVPEKKAEMQAQMVMGSALWTVGAGLALSGKITGGGPSNPEQRRLLGNEWQPYSLVVEGEDGNPKYLAFSRLDPFGLFFGIAADMAELHGTAKYRPDDEVYLAAAQSVARNLANKTYLRGIFDFVDALSHPDRGLEKFVSGFAASHIPAILNPTMSADDPLLEVRNVIDAVRRRTPGLGEGLDPQRNILGEVIYSSEAWGPDFASPIAMKQSKGDHLSRRLFTLLHHTDDTIKYPPRAENGVSWLDYKNDKGQSAYDRYLELIAQPRSNQPALRESLERAFVEFDKRGDVSEEVQVMKVREVYAKYRSAAKAQAYREFPELHTALFNAKVQENYGNVPGVNLGVLNSLQ